MSYRKNPENTTAGKNMGSNIVIGQEQLENAADDSGSKLETIDAKTRIIPAGDGGSTQRVAHGATIAKNAGVVMPTSDKTGVDPYPGKAAGNKIL